MAGKVLCKREAGHDYGDSQSEVLVLVENYRCSVNEIKCTSPATQVVNVLCDRISLLAGLPVEKRQTESKKLVVK